MTNQCKSAAREIRANGGILDIYGEKVNVIEGFFYVILRHWGI
jgi:hypothetical protein